MSAWQAWTLAGQWIERARISSLMAVLQRSMDELRKAAKQ
jgi:hypothetical protein